MGCEIMQNYRRKLNKLFIGLTCVLFMLMCSACGYAKEVNKARIDMDIQNLRVNSVLTEYKKNIEIVQKFNILFLPILSDKELYSTEVENYVSHRVLKDTIDYIYDYLDSYFLEDDSYNINDLNVFPMMEENGQVVEVIYYSVYSESKSVIVYMEIEWANSEIVDYNYMFF